MSSSGTVYLVGAGPGAADLVTVRAAKLLERADIVFYDALVPTEILAQASRAEKVAVGKRCGRHSTAQRFINKRLIDAASRYRIIVRLKGGDPMLFGRSQEEIDALRSAGIPVEVVPGITAASAAASELRISLTRRGVSRSVTFTTPRVGAGRPPSDWSAALAHADTAAIYMGAAQAHEVAAALLGAGHAPTTPVAICESVSLPHARVLTGGISELPHLASQLGDGPALIFVGEVFRDLAPAGALNDAVVAGRRFFTAR